MTNLDELIAERVARAVEAQLPTIVRRALEIANDNGSARRWVSTKEMAGLASVNEVTLRRLAPECPAAKLVGRLWRWDPVAFNSWGGGKTDAKAT